MTNLEELAQRLVSHAAKEANELEDDLLEAAAAIRELLAERESFHMRYRMEADADSKAAIVRAEAAEAKLAELLAQKPVAYGNADNLNESNAEDVPVIAWRKQGESLSGGRWIDYDVALYAAPVPAVNEADELLCKLGLDPATYRTDDGAINHMKVRAAILNPNEYPTASAVDLAEARRLRDWCALYLSTGGLFNPELAQHRVVSDLIRECRDYLDKLGGQR